jgi:hypothetical protein
MWEITSIVEILERLGRIIEIGQREAKKGLWADPAPVPPWEWRKRN